MQAFLARTVVNAYSIDLHGLYTGRPMEVLTTRVPEELSKAIREIEKEEGAERAEVVRRLLDRAVRDWKISKALRMISEGSWTVTKGARQK